MPPIPFDLVPANNRVPSVLVEFTSRLALQGATLQNFKALLAGQRMNTTPGTNGGTAVGTATSGVPYRLSAPEDAKNLFGQGSHLHAMAIAWFAQNKFTEVWALGLDDAPSAVVATGTVTFTASSPTAGTAYVYVAGRRYALAVTAASTATTIAAALVAAIAADRTVPVTAQNTAGAVTLTAKNAGTTGNKIDVRHSHNVGEALPTGVTCTIVAMASGATDPDVAAVFTAVGDTWFNVFACPWADATNMGKIQTELDDRWGPLRSIEMFAFLGADGDVATVTTLAANVNSGHMSVMPTNKSPSPLWELAAASAAQVAQYANVDPARPFNGLPLATIVAPKIQDRFTIAQRNSLLAAGVATTRVDDGGNVVLERVVTTYRTNAVGAADVAFLDSNTHFTNGYLRYDIKTYLALKYPRAKLATSSSRLQAGQTIVSVDSLRGELVARFLVWESLGLVEDVDGFKSSMVVERNANDVTRIDFQISPNLTNPLISIAGQIAFIL